MTTFSKIIPLFVLLALAGCSHTTGIPKASWPVPSPPEMKEVNFQETNGGYFLTEEDAVSLADNVDGMKAYTKKLEVLIKKMKKFYDAK